MKKVIVSTLVLSLIVLGFGAFSVEAQMGNKAGGVGNRINNDIQRPAFQSNVLDLDEEQTDQIAEIKESHFDKREQLIEELQTTQRELRTELLKNESPEKISALEEQVETLRAQIDQARTDYLNEVKTVLTEEQVQKMAENEYRLGLASGNSYGSNNANTYNQTNRTNVNGTARGQARGRHVSGMRGRYNNTAK